MTRNFLLARSELEPSLPIPASSYLQTEFTIVILSDRICKYVLLYHSNTSESTPVCGTTLNASEQGVVYLWCRVNFTGFWPPRMHWTQGEIHLESKPQRSSTSISSTLTVKAESGLAKTNYTCKTYFAAEDNTLKDEIGIARNVPNYTFTFTSG